MYKLIFFVLLTSILFSCKKERLIDILPEATEDGKNTLGFKVENKVWVPQWIGNGWGERCEELNVEFLPNNKHFNLSAGIKVNGKKSYFHLSIDSLFEGSNLFYSHISLSDSYAMFIFHGGYYQSACYPSVCNTAITITPLDTVNKIVSGIFYAKLKKQLITGFDFRDIHPGAPEYVEIQDGRFDVHYDYCR